MKRLCHLLFLLLLVTSTGLYAEIFFSERGFYIDLPEGFEFSQGDGKNSFSFISLDGNLALDIYISDDSGHKSADAELRDIARQLGSTVNPSLFTYAGRGAALGEVIWGTGTNRIRGIIFYLEPEANTPEGYELAILVYTRSEIWQEYSEIALSALDGFSAGEASLSAPGPVGTKLRQESAPLKKETKSISFGTAAFKIEYSPEEAEIAQELTEREYRVLYPYGAIPELTEAAMARFYRMVQRDSAPSLMELAYTLSMLWTDGSWKGDELFPKLGAGVRPQTGPRFGTAADSRGYAQALLKWTQGWQYERSIYGSDLVNPLSAAMEGRGDCDSRALVIITILGYDAIDAILMVSLEHQHALVAVDVPGPGARFPFEKKAWLVGETTANVDIGLIDSAQADPADWFGVSFP